MKIKILKLTTFLLLLTMVSCEPAVNEGNLVTFSVDMSGIDLSVTDTVGIRGSVAPLSWTETYPLEGPDENGIYSATIVFKDLECGTRIQYKYIYADSVWDNDMYGENGNRLYTFCCADRALPIDTWNKLDEFTMETLLSTHAWDELGNMIYTIALAKKQGMGMDELARDMVDFWEWPVPYQDLEAFIVYDQVQQAMYPFGEFELITYTPEKVEYTIKKYWEQMMYTWDEDGIVKGVSADEMTELFRHLTFIYVDLYGLKLDRQEIDDFKIKYTITK